MKLFLTPTLMVTLALVSIAGCESSITATTNTISTVRPGIGSKFVYRGLVWDTLGTLTQDFVDTEVVYQSGISYQGKNNVITISYSWDTALKNALYYNYEPNGDIEDYYNIPGVRSGWRTYPIESKGSSSFLQFDTTIINPSSGQQIHSFQEFIFTYATDSAIVEAGQTLNAIDILLGGENQSGYFPGNEDYWIAPSVGTMVRIVSQNEPPYYQNISRFEYHLVSYTLK
jgi:hypothetical protein